MLPNPVGFAKGKLASTGCIHRQNTSDISLLPIWAFTLASWVGDLEDVLLISQRNEWKFGWLKDLARSGWVVPRITREPDILAKELLV